MVGFNYTLLWQSQTINALRLVWIQTSI